MYDHAGIALHCGDSRAVLAELPRRSVRCCVTSPPYFGLRDYGVDGQIGLEPSPAAYVAELVALFAAVREVLTDDGTLFLNLGDSYFGSSQTGGTNSKEGSSKRAGRMFARGGHAQAHDSADTVGADSPVDGQSSGSLDDGRIDSWWLRSERTDARRAREQALEPLIQIRACMAELISRLPTVDCSDPQPTQLSSDAIRDRVQTAHHAIEQLRASLASTQHESAPPPPAGFRLLDMLSACLSSLHALSLCVRRCARMLDELQEQQRDREGSAALCDELVHHIRCTDGYCSLVLSWLNTPHIQPQYTTKLKAKDLLGIPWRVAFALQADGWYLRSDIVWAKPNPMPESVRDRPTRSHEYIFLLSKRASYYYDADAIAEEASHPFDLGLLRGRSFADGVNVSAHAPSIVKRQMAGVDSRTAGAATRNKRDVWTVASDPYPEAHFATFPPALITPCILAGSAPGDTVLDPFSGSGTTAMVAKHLGRRAVGVELNPAYCDLAAKRLQQDVLPLEVPA